MLERVLNRTLVLLFRIIHLVRIQNFPKKNYFSYALIRNVRLRIRGNEMLVLRKIFRS